MCTAHYRLGVFKLDVWLGDSRYVSPETCNGVCMSREKEQRNEKTRTNKQGIKRMTDSDKQTCVDPCRKQGSMDRNETESKVGSFLFPFLVRPGHPESSNDAACGDPINITSP